MGEGAFSDRTKKPTSDDFARELGRSWAAWEWLVSELRESFAPVTEEWRFTGGEWGWTLRMKRKERTMIYLLPCRKYFRVAVVLGDKAVKKALRAGLPKPVATAVRRATKYAEGRVIRLDLRSKKDLPAIMQLVNAKMST